MTEISIDRSEKQEFILYRYVKTVLESWKNVHISLYPNTHNVK